MILPTDYVAKIISYSLGPHQGLYPEPAAALFHCPAAFQRRTEDWRVRSAWQKPKMACGFRLCSYLTSIYTIHN